MHFNDFTTSQAKALLPTIQRAHMWFKHLRESLEREEIKSTDVFYERVKRIEDDLQCLSVWTNGLVMRTNLAKDPSPD